MRVNMNKQEVFFVFFAIYLQVTTCNVIGGSSPSSRNTSSPDSKAQIIRVVIHNNVDSTFEYQYSNLHWGSWSRSPSNIGALSEGGYMNQGSTFAGPENDVVYKYRDYGQYGNFKIYTNVDHWSENFKYRLECSREFEEFFNIRTISRSYYDLIISIEVKIPNDFNVFISGDPQPYRTFGGNDPNESKDHWERENKVHADRIIERNWDAHFHFGIINGDITEYGRKSQRESYEKIYANRLPFKLFLGLGNHDYDNNIDDCWDVGYPNTNGCAVSSVVYMNRKLEEYGSILDNYHYDYYPHTGSMAYRFDYANYTFIQLHNYPSYERQFSSGLVIKIRSSLQWLRQELSKTNKNVILCLHDMSRYLTNNDPNTNSFKEIVNNSNVKLIFAGHTHYYGKSSFGSATVFTNHALFGGGFFRVNFKNNCASVYKHDDVLYGQVCFK